MAVHENYIKAGNPETPVDVLRSLIVGADAAVRRRLAENPKTPEDMLIELSKDSNTDVRGAVAENEKTPRAVLEQLSKDESVQVRYALAGHYTLPIDLLEVFAESDENPYVKDHARRTLEGIFLEEALREAGFTPRSGEIDKLGDLLVGAEVLQQEHVEELLRISKERQIPLGHAVVESRCVKRSVVVAALKAQRAVRDSEISHEDAIWQIKHTWGSR